mmetsp:Transcript_44105/g.139172  ORF Transcript_44105/g.139172 Transcript_44105/m.139172 type:complete len:83 (-) Transcript_44105:142-390(-)
MNRNFQYHACTIQREGDEYIKWPSSQHHSFPAKFSIQGIHVPARGDWVITELLDQGMKMKVRTMNVKGQDVSLNSLAYLPFT